jgi:hypothetical protein
MENNLKKNRLDRLLGRKSPKGIYSYSKKKSCRRKGKDHTLALMRYWKWQRMIIRKTASSMVSHLLSQMTMPSILRKMSECLEVYPVAVGVDKGSEEGDRTVIQSFNVDMGPCERGASPLIDCIVPLKQEEILRDNLVDVAVQRSIPSEEMFKGIVNDWKPIKEENKAPSVEILEGIQDNCKLTKKED